MLTKMAFCNATWHQRASAASFAFVNPGYGFVSFGAIGAVLCSLVYRVQALRGVNTVHVSTQSMIGSRR